MGTTGSSKSVNLILPQLVSRVRAYTSVPLAVGFGVYNRHHFEVVAGAGADGVVVGSRVVDVIGEAGPDLPNITKKITSSCAELTLHGQPRSSRLRKHTGVSLASQPLPTPANGNQPQLLSNNEGNSTSRTLRPVWRTIRPRGTRGLLGRAGGGAQGRTY